MAGGAAAPPPQQATGPTPAATAVPNRGSEQAALLAIGLLAAQIQRKLADLPFGSDAAQAISEGLNKIRKHVPPPGAVSSGVERTQLDAMQNAQRQNAIRMAMMRQQQHGEGAPTMPVMRPPPQLTQPSAGM